MGWGLARLESMVTFIREVILGEKSVGGDRETAERFSTRDDQ